MIAVPHSPNPAHIPAALRVATRAFLAAGFKLMAGIGTLEYTMLCADFSGCNNAVLVEVLISVE
jgi:hypothetical protein